MIRLREFLFRVQPIFRRRKVDEELSAELRSHLEMATEANVAAGMDPISARVAAEREFGRWQSIQQDYRDARGLSWIEHLVQDISFGTRMLRKSPLFTTVVVTTLALGIGVNSALFSALSTLLLRAPAVEEPERLVGLFRRISSDNSFNRISYPDYEILRDRTKSLSAVAAYCFTPVHFSSHGETSRVWGQLVTPNYFSVLGVRLSAGHGFTKAREPRAMELEAVLSHDFWRRRFDGDMAIVGRTIVLNGNSFTVVGVAPPTFHDLEPWLVPDVWVPIGAQTSIMPGENRLDASGYSWLRVVARLAPETTLSQARAEVGALAGNIRRERGPGGSFTTIAVVPDIGLHPDWRPMIRGYFAIMMAAAGVVLVIVCVNLAMLWLARSMTRWKEMATRLALGATRARLFRQMIIESMIVTAIGGMFALGITPLLLHAIELLQAHSAVPAPVEFHLDYRVFVFSGVVSVSVGFALGSLPAWTAAKTDILGVLKHGAPGHRVKPSTWRTSFVGLQIAASFVLLGCAGLFFRSLQQTRQIDLGFEPERVLVASVDLGLQGYSPTSGQRFHQEVKRAVAAMAGIESVGLADAPPLNPLSEDTRVWFDLPDRVSNGDSRMVHFAVADEDYFTAVGLPLIRGRGFSSADNSGTERVAVVNETFAKMIAVSGDAVGHTVRLDPAGPSYRIIGVARDGKYLTLGEAPRPFLYLALAQNYRATVTLIMRTAVPPAALIGPVTRAVQGIDPHLPVYRAMSLVDHVASQHFVPHWAALLLGLFAALAFLLALLGVFGVTAYDASQRTREFGVRVAFGAMRRDIVKMLLKKALKPLFIGVGLGVVSAFATARFVGGFLYRVNPLEPYNFCFVGALVIAATLLAAILPGWRAAKVAPTDALRHE